MKCHYTDGKTEELECKAPCRCACCRQDEERKVFYTVKPYDWSVGSHPGHGRSGTGYQIMEMRSLATAKCKEDADKIVRALNRAKVSERTISQLTAEVECLKSQKGVTLEQLECAMGAAAMAHCRWSHDRKTVKEFGTEVMARLRVALD